MRSIANFNSVAPATACSSSEVRSIRTTRYGFLLHVSKADAAELQDDWALIEALNNLELAAARFYDDFKVVRRHKQGSSSPDYLITVCGPDDDDAASALGFFLQGLFLQVDVRVLKEGQKGWAVSRDLFCDRA